MNPLLLTTAELAKRWDLSEGTLRNWRSQGKGPPSVRLGKGGPVRYALEVVIKWESTYRKNPYNYRRSLDAVIKKRKRASVSKGGKRGRG